jgi:GLPGLI family protein
MVCYPSFTISAKTASRNPGKLYIMKKILILSVVVLISQLKATAQFISKGSIEYEKRTNQHALLDENSVWDAAAKKGLPQFVTSYFDLKFDRNHTFYKPGREPDTKQNTFWGMLDVENQVATNLDSNTFVNAKTMEGGTYLFSGKTRDIQWKIASETRTIAGFECRKAVGRIMDTVVVIAFYTDEILPSGGPESFCGLPGMILGIAIPRLHTTWYATKLQLVDVTPNDLAAPKKGKKVDMDEFKKQMKSLMQNWGANAGNQQIQMAL